MDMIKISKTTYSKVVSENATWGANNGMRTCRRRKARFQGNNEADAEESPKSAHHIQGRQSNIYK
jgi:hypothetical protein